jgi:hypothetical protein
MMTDRTGERPHSPADSTTRRRLLRGLAGAGVLAGLAGCVSNVGRGPDADIVWEETDPELDAVNVRQVVTVTAMVVNVGDPGEVEVIADARTVGREDPFDSHSLTIEMERNEQREISFDMEVSPAAEFLDARAEAA